MNEKEFAVWKRRQEEDIIRLRRESDALRRESAEIRRESDARMAKLDKRFGGYIDTESARLEDDFYDALCAAGKIGGDKLEEVYVRVEVRRDGISAGEYDLICINGGKIFVGEIKHKLTAEKVREFGAEKLRQYGKYFPATARGKKILGMVGGAQIDETAAKTARKMGMYILRLQKNHKLKVEAPK